METKKVKLETQQGSANVLLPEPQINDLDLSFLNPRGSKTINDPVHGYFEISDFCLQFVDTPQFQRLRSLKQLGTSYFVFPGASHARFEHCLGTSYLAAKWITRLQANQPELEIMPRDVRLLSLAGLCHDLGHGPFSHSFEHIVRKIKGNSWSHEQMSRDMFDYLVDDNNIDIEKSDMDLVKDLIDGKPRHSQHEKRFLFDIVSNSRNSIDVDKFDYLSRDCYNLGIKSSWDYNRLMKFSRVINDEICFYSKEAYNIYEMFHTRYSMHKTVYSHRVGGAIESMISDCLAAADSVLNIFDTIEDPASYMQLNDSILNQIESSKDPQLDESRRILRRLRKRELYKCVDEILIPQDKIDQIHKIEEKEICNYGQNLRPEDITLRRVVMNYAMKEKNPVDNCSFFSQWEAKSSFPIQPQDVSLLIPKNFSETYLRIYVKDPENQERAQQAFRNYLGHKTNLTPSPAFALKQSGLREAMNSPPSFSHFSPKTPNTNK